MTDLGMLSLTAKNAHQIAQYGHTLSVNLFTYRRRVGNTTKVIDTLCNDISSTGAALKELGQALSTDVFVRLCSQAAVKIVATVVEETKSAFTNIEAFVSGDSRDAGQDRAGLSNQQNQLPVLEHQVEQIQTHLEKLKLSLLLILNVLIFAEQIQKREPLLILKDQRELVRTLAAEQLDSDERYAQMKTPIPERSTLTSGPNHLTSTAIPQALGPHPNQGHTRAFSTSAVETGFVMSPMSTTSPLNTAQFNIPNIDLHASLRHHYERIQHHSYLVGTLLTEISSPRYKLDHGTRDRLHNGLLNLHWNEWGRYRGIHGQEVFDRMLLNHAEIARYWADQAIDVGDPRYLQPSPPPSYGVPSSGHTAFGLGIGSPTIGNKKFNFDNINTPTSNDVSHQTEDYDPGSIDNVLRNNSRQFGASTPSGGNPSTKSRRQPSVTLQPPWHSPETGERRPSIEVTAPEYFPAGVPQHRSVNSPTSRVRPTVDIPLNQGSPATSGAQTPVSPSDLTPTRKFSYERLRSPSGSSQTSPAISPSLRQATLAQDSPSSSPKFRQATPAQNSPIVSPRLRQATMNSARAVNAEPDLSRRNSRTAGSTRPRTDRASSSTYDEVLLSPDIARKSSVKDKANGLFKLKDALGRKFYCPVEKCSTWEEMHNRIEAQFRQHPENELLPEVQIDEYDLFLPDGQRIPIADWARTVCTGLRVTMLLRFGKPEAGFRRKDCLIPFDGEHILAPEMLQHITKQDPHNAYRTTVVAAAATATPSGPFPANATSPTVRFAAANMQRSKSDSRFVAEDMRRQTSDPGQKSTAYNERPSIRTDEPSLFSLDEVDRLVLRLTNLRQSELKRINWAEEPRG